MFLKHYVLEFLKLAVLIFYYWKPNSSFFLIVYTVGFSRVFLRFRVSCNFTPVIVLTRFADGNDNEVCRAV